MKKKFFILVCFIFGMSNFTLFAQEVFADVPIYRLYNRNNGEHLYTTSENEKNVLYSQHGWGYEGIS
ncbi:hypothetical protein D3X11_00420 [Streptococcus sp. X16XC17]|uniref:hypothetical protein n=1 Tax=unclassified Streptococcus TaxID=2608887 RepID=UPI00066FC953|nr:MULTISPECIES: hypothetical protein [unclassified Streptococcus]TCD45984.1 hypothetical protein D3X11_00420 [Streptococcus sp. X16XC17]